MCDSFAARPGATASGSMLFAKNSDRERNEAQLLELLPRRKHAADAEARLTYITIPQARQTNAVLLSRPFWMWGAEMGANEHGVVIGNEAMFASIPAGRKRALVGMDLVRLGLERASTAADAVDLITCLLEKHGQGGDCGHLNRLYYQNGFIVADPKEAFVVETVGRWWTVEKVHSVRALSNALSIGRSFHQASDALRMHAEDEGWCAADGSFDFAGRFIDEARDGITFGRGRCARGTALLERQKGRLTALGMMAILRDHGEGAEANPHWHPIDTVGRTICMHAAAGPRLGQTTGSMVSELRDGSGLHWMTGTAAPCTSIFKPVVLAAGLPRADHPPTDKFDGKSLWWRHESLHRFVLKDFAHRLETIREERDALERSFVERIDVAWKEGGPSSAQMRNAVRACWREADATERRWASASGTTLAPRMSTRVFDRSWNRFSDIAAMPRA